MEKMIDGVTALYSEDIIIAPGIGACVIISLVLFAILFAAIYFLVKTNPPVLTFLFSALLIIGYFCIIFGLFTGKFNYDTGRNRYKCCVDDTVTMAEFFSHYNFIEQDGNIFIVEDK